MYPGELIDFRAGLTEKYLEALEGKGYLILKLRKMALSFIAPLILSLLVTATASAAPAAPSKSRPSFSNLTRRLRIVSKKVDTILFTKRVYKTKGRSLSAVRARAKGAKAVGGEADGSKALGLPIVPIAASVSTALPVEPLPDDVPRIKVGGTGNFIAELEGGKTAAFSNKRAPAVGYWKNRYFLVEGNKTLAVSSKPVRFKAAGSGAVLSLPDYTDMNWNKTVNLNLFRGTLEIAYSTNSKKLWAVNELFLEDYLRGIAEGANDSPMEHLKVMSILARSYAVHHLSNGGRHPGEPFQLKNSCNGNGDDQVYRGYLAETRQPRVAQGAANTAGIVVTYKGQPVITPYSTRASGRTRSPAEAGWKVDWPWVKSVPDPDTAGMSRIGHGVGLSGYGSRKRAERGETAAQITGYYFPGTALGHVNTGNQLVRVAIFGK
jgi:hypothetical protein